MVERIRRPTDYYYYLLATITVIITHSNRTREQFKIKLNKKAFVRFPKFLCSHRLFLFKRQDVLGFHSEGHRTFGNIKGGQVGKDTNQTGEGQEIMQKLGNVSNKKRKIIYNQRVLSSQRM